MLEITRKQVKWWSLLWKTDVLVCRRVEITSKHAYRAGVSTIVVHICFVELSNSIFNSGLNVIDHGYPVKSRLPYYVVI